MPDDPHINKEYKLMKKLVTLLVLFVMLFATSCAANGNQTSGNGIVLIRVNVEGLGEIATTEDGSEPVFDEEYTFTSSAMNVAKGTTVGIATRTEYEDYQFVKWTKNGEDYSTDMFIYPTADEDAEYIAVYALAGGYDGPAIDDINDAKTLGDILGLPYYGTSTMGNVYARVFELNGTLYRAASYLTEEQFQALFDLDFSDPDYDKKQNDILAPLTIDVLDDLSELEPSEEELSTYQGKTLGELMDDGWSFRWASYEDKQCGMEHGLFSYIVEYEGELEEGVEIDEESIRDMTVKSVVTDGIGDPAAGLVEEG